MQIHGPATMAFKVSMAEFTGPAMDGPILPVLPHLTEVGKTPDKYSVQIDCGDWVGMHPDTLTAVELVPYQIKTKEGELLMTGITNAEGLTQRVYTSSPKDLVLYIGDGDWHYGIDYLHDTDVA